VKRALVLIALIFAGCAAPSTEGPTPFARSAVPPPEERDFGAIFEYFGACAGQVVLVAPAVGGRHCERTLDVPSSDALPLYAQLYDLEWTQLAPDVVLLDENPVIRSGRLEEGTLRALLEGLADHGELSVVLPARLKSGEVRGARRGERWSDAFARVCSENDLHCARFGSVLAVSHDAITGGAPLEDADSPRATFEAAASQLSDRAVTIDADDACFGNVVVDVARQLGRRARFTTPVTHPLRLHVKHVSGIALLSWLVREGHVRTALEGDELVFSQPSLPGPATIVLKDAPSAGALRLVARGLGREVIIEGQPGLALSGELTRVAPLDALRALAAAASCSLDERSEKLVLRAHTKRLEKLVLRAHTKGLEDLEESGRKLQGFYEEGPRGFALVSGSVGEMSRRDRQMEVFGQSWPEWPFGD